MGIHSEMKSAVYSLFLHYGYGSCPCRKIGEDFGEVRMGNEHLAQDDLTQFYAHVDTPIGNEQQEDYAFLLRFSEPVTAFMQYFGEDNTDSSDSFVDDVIITPSHRISGDPYTFNVNGLVENGNVAMDAWYCESSEDIENVAAACFSDGQSAQDEENNEGSGDETEEPQWDCDTYTRCVVKFNTEMTIGNARSACDAHNGVLPFAPKNDEENLELAMIGSTWLNFWVNDKIDMKYDNFERRQRAYLNAEQGGVWEIRHGTETADFFCVEKETDGCPNIFHSTVRGADLFNQGAGVWRKKADSAFRQFDENTAEEFAAGHKFPLGTVFQYKCGQKLANYKPWRRNSKMVQIKCVRMNNGDFDYVECNNRKCDSFDRFAWFNEKLFKQRNGKSQFFC